MYGKKHNLYKKIKFKELKEDKYEYENFEPIEENYKKNFKKILKKKYIESC